jgi:hypothetical protein
MTFNLISSKDRLPKLWKTYFVIVDGRKDIVNIPWIQKHLARWPDHEFYWLEEEEIFPPAKKKPGPKPRPKAIIPPYQFPGERRPWDKD